MSTVKERILGAVTIMSEEDAEKVWDLIRGTDHTREYVPFIAYSKKMKETGAIENQDTFAVIGASVAENFGVQMPEGTIGRSILKELQ